MSLNIDFSLIPSNIPSICIPYVFETISDPRIMGIFREMNFGTIERIEKNLYTAKDGRKVNRVFVYLNWKINEKTDKVRTDLLCGKEIIITYDNPWFWKISAKQEIIKKQDNTKINKPTFKPSLPIAPTLQIAPIQPTTPTKINDVYSSDEEEECIIIRHKKEPEFNVKEYTSKFPSSNELPKKKKRTIK
jgi:hypothetical protein